MKEITRCLGLSSLESLLKVCLNHLMEHYFPLKVLLSLTPGYSLTIQIDLILLFALNSSNSEALQMCQSKINFQDLQIVHSGKFLWQAI